MAQPSRFQELISMAPPGSLLVTGILLSVYVAQLVLGFSLSAVCISATSVVHQRQLWRLLTSAFVHGNLLHIGFNTLTFVILGPLVEGQFGTMVFCYVVILTSILCSTLYVMLCFALSIVVGPSILSRSAVGFSGVLFAFIVLESEMSRGSHQIRPIFGYPIPNRLYPWVLLGLTQVMVPNVSFLGHLSGILVGYILVTPVSNYLVPSFAFVRNVESNSAVQVVTRSCATYKYPPTRTLVVEGNVNVITDITKTVCQHCSRIADRWQRRRSVMTVSGTVGRATGSSEVTVAASGLPKEYKVKPYNNADEVSEKLGPMPEATEIL